MLKHLLFAASLLAATPACAQAPSPVPASYTFNSSADYTTYAPQVVETVNWLEKSTLPADNPQRRQANKFLLEWVSGSPTVTIQVGEYIGSLYQKNPDLLMAFMGGWARYAIQHPEVKDQLTLHTEGIKTMLTAYQAQGGKGNKKLDELTRINADDQLPAWVKSHAKL